MGQRSYESRQNSDMGQRSCGFKGQKMSINDSPEEFISDAGHSPNIISAYEGETSQASKQSLNAPKKSLSVLQSTALIQTMMRLEPLTKHIRSLTPV